MKPGYSLAIIVILGLLVYGNTLNGGLVWDDPLFIEDRSPISHLENIPFFFTNNIARGTAMPHAVPYYRPLHMTAMALQYALWGQNPFGYHLVNLILHIALAILVYLLGRQLALGEWGSLSAALLYTLHPVHSESVAYIGGNSELQYSLFYLAALYCYLRARVSTGPAWLAGALLLYLCSLLTKESALTLPLLLLVFEAADRSGPLSKRALRVSLFAAISALYLALRFQFVKEISWLDTPFADRFYTSCGIVARYLWNLLAPFDLKVLYDIPVKLSLFRWDVAGPLLLVLALGVILARLLRSSTERFSGLLMLLPMLPASGLPMILLPVPMADRYLTLPLAGYALLASLLLERWHSRVVTEPVVRRGGAGRLLRFSVPGAVFLIVCLVFGVMTVQRNLLWHDRETIARRMTVDAPGHFLGYELLGTILGTQGEYAAMAQSYLLAEQKTRDRNLEQGREYLRLGRAEEGLALFDRMLKQFSSDPKVLNGMGEALMMKGRSFEALEMFRQGARICPSCTEIAENLRKAESAGSWKAE
ncbi:transmembrane and TPR repeat-containing protein F38B6.6 [Geobacter sp. OR-1]|uniref:ArnT family glycosyltransferase n=1 Tax=Geobacter sp. OR-1 TaxID=1266765 RepID=UPI000542E64A|nr:glycosyltransferase family 39 protein [Geobacter sp. OR-1]GAM09149.1 transmembrane and TPR repeat-containing protein F38B6.6 [Geobacter sp. OR-1]